MTHATKTLGTTTLQVHPLCFGGNVFGWTADEATSFKILDAYVESGGNFIDTADTYSSWVPGHPGGESETIIGKWLVARKNRDRIVIATKVGMMPAHMGLGAKTIQAAVEGSLKRLKTDVIDLYYAHKDDPKTPLDETAQAFDTLVKQGKVRYVGASNYSAERLAEALSVAKQAGHARFEVLQTEYNLMVRKDYEESLRDVCVREKLACLPYWSLAKGFLTGKYRPGVKVDSVRAGGAGAYLDARGERVLKVLDEVAGTHTTTVAAVALAWLAAEETVGAVIASARTLDQLKDILPLTDVKLSAEETAALSSASQV